MIIRYVKATAWPWRTDLVVRDETSQILAHYRRQDDDLCLGRKERIKMSLEALEQEQDLLRLHYASHSKVRLECDWSDEAQLADLFEPYGIASSLLEFEAWPQLQRKLSSLSAHKMWELVADWFDRYEVSQPVGQSRDNPPQWLVQAHPDQAKYWTWLASQEGSQDAWLLFRAHYSKLDLDAISLCTMSLP